MTDDRDDPLLDACLDEVLGGHAPPDLSARILRAWSLRSSQNGNGAVARTSAASGHEQDRVGQPANSPGPRFVVSPAPSRNGSHRKSTRKTTIAAAAAVALSVAVCACVLVWIAIAVSRPDGANERLAGGAPADQNDSAATAADSAPHVSPDKPAPDNHTPDNQVVDGGRRPAPRPPDDADHLGAAHGFGDPPDFVGPTVERNSVEPAPIVQQKPQRLAPSPRAEILAFIGESFESAWKEFNVQPSPPATDAEWCRRTYLRIAGRIPSVDELKAFLDNRDKNKHEQLVDELLASDDFAAHWSFLMTNLLIGRSGGMRADDAVSREDLQQYLRDALHENKPYDELAFELISATGSSRRGAPDYNPAVNYLIANQGPRATLATARTSQVFLGKKLQCVQCHNHHTNGWKQHQFWEMNAFFRQMQVEGKGAETKLVNQDFTGESGAGEADVYYEQPNGELRVAYPAFGPADDAATRSGLLADADLRRELAGRIIATDDLARTEVNRVWSHFFGYGFTQPVDDMGPHNEPLYPAVIERLAGEYAAHDYDTKELIRWIALSEPFSLSSKVLPENTADAPEYGERPLFARYYTRQMQPEEVYQSLQVAAGLGPGGDFTQQEQAKLAWLGQFTRDMQTDEGDETSSFDGAFGQSLVLMNGPLTRRVVSREDGSMLARLAASSLTRQQKIEHLFLSSVARKPHHRELELVDSMFAASNNEAETLQTIWWALLNSNEFILDH